MDGDEPVSTQTHDVSSRRSGWGAVWWCCSLCDCMFRTDTAYVSKHSPTLLLERRACGHRQIITSGRKQQHPPRPGNRWIGMMYRTHRSRYPSISFFGSIFSARITARSFVLSRGAPALVTFPAARQRYDIIYYCLHVSIPKFSSFQIRSSCCPWGDEVVQRDSYCDERSPSNH